MSRCRAAFSAWKRYRGGMATPIWIANLSDSSVEKVPRVDSNDFNPMWVGDKVYFLSDRNGPITLFAYDTKTKKVAQLIQNNGLDIKSASAGPDGDRLRAVRRAQPLRSEVGQDQTGQHHDQRRYARRCARNTRRSERASSNAAISPTGARAVFEARGEIITVPAEKGDARNLTNTTGHGRARPVLVARRQMDRLFLRRIGRVSALTCATRREWAK